MTCFLKLLTNAFVIRKMLKKGTVRFFRAVPVLFIAYFPVLRKSVVK